MGKKRRGLFYPFKRWTALGHWIVLGNHARMMPELANITITSKGETLDELPTYSGVYRFFSSENTLLYVGKSIDIRARVQSHIQEGRKPGRHQRIMSQVSRIETQSNLAIIFCNPSVLTSHRGVNEHSTVMAYFITAVTSTTPFGGTPVTTDSACVCLGSTQAKGLAFSTS